LDGRCRRSFSAPPAPAARREARDPDADRAVIVLFQENISFDHYSPPIPSREPAGRAGLSCRTGHADGQQPDRGAGGVQSQHRQPFRLSPREAATCDMDHGYTAEQRPSMRADDKFVEYTTPGLAEGCDPNGVMAYFDGKR